MIDVILVGCIFIILGTLTVLVVTREPLRTAWIYILLGVGGVVGLVPLALGLTFALYTFLPVLLALPILIAMMRPRRMARHVRAVPQRYRRPPDTATETSK